MTDDSSSAPEDFATYLERRWRASDAFVAGDPEPLLAVSTTRAPASIFGPPGTVVTGPDAVNDGNAAGAARFTGADRNDVEAVHSGSDGDLGWWTGIQRSVVRFAGQDDPVPMDLRVTELYRREDGRWALFHRHADLLKE
ncbi:YybH family protein [Phycicoccus flavus]|uniref:YybH family protein n=1 Tax=Phycicoccus flavus TaxID=2502783 RepID=UPI000FEBE296|nr:nuclear transport factor 2 family protein [Phycicoccus flavus]NHA69306.1 nuclear transport factor 2 family protein [Phycicoccus flavus]